MDSCNRKEGCQSTQCTCNGMMNQTTGKSAEGLADPVRRQAGNPLREPVAAGQANYGPYRYRPMVRGYGHGSTIPIRQIMAHTDTGPWCMPMASVTTIPLRRACKQDIHICTITHTMSCPPCTFPQAAAPPRNAKDGEPDLCRIM
ncbi:hypothetical protein OIU77_022294 [Salix suchowensis]|uniref:Uncharacterized protein n=1 Tax=Salix suchowensis TaxID=1278906 RepID=A0ABQ9BZQ2_9ROSI|nr:hypothetical protein OIU77_022294 [Salix suchowensis]